MCRLMQEDCRRKQMGQDGEKDALDCWDDERKRKQKRAVVRRGKNHSSVHPEVYDKSTETGPKNPQGGHSLELRLKHEPQLQK